eukprot:6291069-Prymnesium_polylepis.1
MSRSLRPPPTASVCAGMSMALEWTCERRGADPSAHGLHFVRVSLSRLSWGEGSRSRDDIDETRSGGVWRSWAPRDPLLHVPPLVERGEDSDRVPVGRASGRVARSAGVCT